MSDAARVARSSWQQLGTASDCLAADQAPAYSNTCVSGTRDSSCHAASLLLPPLSQSLWNGAHASVSRALRSDSNILLIHSKQRQDCSRPSTACRLHPSVPSLCRQAAAPRVQGPPSIAGHIMASGGSPEADGRRSSPGSGPGGRSREPGPANRSGGAERPYRSGSPCHG